MLVSSQYAQVGSTSRGTLKALQAKPKSKTQNFVIGDDTGYLHMFEYQKASYVIILKSQSAEKEITGVELGFTPAGENDKIFYSAGTLVRAMNKKGKEIFKGDTYSSEPVASIQVEGQSIWTTGKYLLNEFEMNSETAIKDKSYYLCQEQINSFYACSLMNSAKVSSILACGDSTIRIVEGDDEVCKYNMKGQVQWMQPFSNNYQFITSRLTCGKSLLFGQNDGELVYMDMKLSKSKKEPTLIWSLKNSEAGISGFDSFDFQGKGSADLLISRDDCSVEYYQHNLNGELELIAKKQIEESITSIQGGEFQTSGAGEFLLSTFSGRIIGIQESNQKFSSMAALSNDSQKTQSIEKQKQDFISINKLKEEIANLEKHAEELEQKCILDNGNVVLANDISFKVEHKLIINPSDATFCLSLKSQYPLELIALQSNLKLDFVGVDAKQIIKSESPEDPQNASLFLVTFRVPDQGLQNIEFKLRAYEGKVGDIKVHLIPSNCPMNCQVLSVPIKPLSLHVRSNETLSPQLPLNTLTFKGAFQVKEMHNYLSEMIPDLPINHEDEIKYTFKSALVGSYLICNYQKGFAEFKSDSVSTIVIVKDFINNSLNQRGTEVSVNWDINDYTIPHMISLLTPLFEEHKQQSIKCKMVPALKELKLQDEEIDFMTPEMKEILSNADQILLEYNNLPQKIEYLKGIVSDLTFDRASLKDLDDPSNKINTIIQLMEKYDYEKVSRYILN